MTLQNYYDLLKDIFPEKLLDYALGAAVVLGAYKLLRMALGIPTFMWKHFMRPML